MSNFFLTRDIDFTIPTPSFTMPTLHTKSEWYIDFKAYDPVSSSLRRKKYMIPMKGRKNDRMKYAKTLMGDLTNRLLMGWSPWVSNSSVRTMTKISVVFEQYISWLDAMERKGSMRHNTVRDYKSRISILNEYISSMSVPVSVVCQLDKVFVGNFLDYLLLDRDVSARSRNNYKIWMSSFYEWMMKKEYVSENIPVTFPTIAEDAKLRQPLTSEQLSRLRSYLYEHDRHYLLAVMMEYYTFIRPIELAQIRLSDISVDRQTVFVASSISKNRRDGMVALNTKVIKMMVELEIFNHPSHCFLFGRKFMPSETQADSRIFRERFVAVRNTLNFPQSIQFYSLKDSGIRDLANAEGIVIARDQARHTDVHTTNKYLKGNEPVHEETKHFDGEL